MNRALERPDGILSFSPMMTFGRYEALFKIAAGGMAEVYAARIRGEAGFEKLVAVKRMLPHLTDDPEFSSMFLDEGRLVANIQSPNVVSTLDLGRADDGALYIVMELVLGVALSSLIKAAVKQQVPIPVPIACEIIAQAASGLDDAHEAKTPTGVHLGIVHRDVSPQNVLVGGDGRVRVVDFGVARALLRQTHTSTGTLKGKFAYFSPEQAAAKDVDQRSDVFALGIVAWETLVMQRLFDGENPLHQIQRVREMPIPIPSSIREDIPTAVSDVVMQALERNPKKRLQTAAAFATALRDAMGIAPARDISRYVNTVAGNQIREMQTRVESALAGEHVETNVLRPSKSGRHEVLAHTPSGPPGPRVADLPTLIRTEEGSGSGRVPPTRLTPTPTPISMVEAPRGDRRLLAVGLAVSVVLIAILGVALIAQQSPSEPIATPLADRPGSTPIVHLTQPAPALPVDPLLAPTPTPTPLAVPARPGPRDRPRPRSEVAAGPGPAPVADRTTPIAAAPHLTTPVVTPVSAPPPTTPTPPTVRTTPAATAAATSHDRTPPPRADETPRTAGLLGNGAFDDPL